MSAHGLLRQLCWLILSLKLLEKSPPRNQEGINVALYCGQLDANKFFFLSCLHSSISLAILFEILTLSIFVWPQLFVLLEMSLTRSLESFPTFKFKGFCFVLLYLLPVFRIEPGVLVFKIKQSKVCFSAGAMAHQLSVLTILKEGPSWTISIYVGGSQPPITPALRGSHTFFWTWHGPPCVWHTLKQTHTYT